MLLDEPRVAAGTESYVVQFRKSSQFGDDVSAPAWAREIAASVCEGAHVRLGHLGTDSVVESVVIPRSRVLDEDEAADLAERIVRRIES